MTGPQRSPGSIAPPPPTPGSGAAKSCLSVKHRASPIRTPASAPGERTGSPRAIGGARPSSGLISVRTPGCQDFRRWQRSAWERRLLSPDDAFHRLNCFRRMHHGARVGPTGSSGRRARSRSAGPAFILLVGEGDTARGGAFVGPSRGLTHGRRRETVFATDMPGNAQELPARATGDICRASDLSVVLDRS